MYPDSILQWLGTTAIVFGLTGLAGILAWLLYSWTERLIDRWENRHERRED